jgi:23S rRNA (uridine2552-2'-O)-methyltransferase
MSQWYSRQVRDTFVGQARREGYLCRSAYKLLEIDTKFKLFLPSTNAVVDLGSSPGSWCQVIRDKVAPEAIVIGVDCLPLKGSVPGTHFLLGDFRSLDVQENLKQQLAKLNLVEKLNVVTSDMCPNRMGGSADYHTLFRLNMNAMTFALNNLAVGGHFVCKVLGGDSFSQELLDRGKVNFAETFHFKPTSSREESAEWFFVAKQKLAKPKSVEGRRYDLDDWPGFRRTSEYVETREGGGTNGGSPPDTGFRRVSQRRSMEPRGPSKRSRKGLPFT